MTVHSPGDLRPLQAWLDGPRERPVLIDREDHLVARLLVARGSLPRPLTTWRLRRPKSMITIL